MRTAQVQIDLQRSLVKQVKTLYGWKVLLTYFKASGKLHILVPGQCSRALAS